VSFQRHYRQLKEELANLKPPVGLEELALAMEQQHQQQAASSLPSTSREPESPPAEPTTPSTPTPSNPPTPTGEQLLMPNSVYDPELVQHV
jgi:hypothetical protein